MASLLPLILAGLAGFAIVLTLSAFWQSLRNLLIAGASVPARNESPQVLARTMIVQEKNAVLQTIRDLRFEHQLGKLSAADLERLEAQYRARARMLLEQLDAQLAPHREEARKRLGRATSSTASTASAAPPVTEDKSESAASTPAADVAGTCAKCSTRNDADAVFCKKCGAPMTPSATESAS